MKKAKLLPFLFQAAQDYREVLLGRQFLFIGQKAKDGPYPVLECLFRKENFMHLTGCQIAEGLSAKNFFDLCIRKRLGFEMFTYQPDAFLKKEVFSSVFALPYTARMMGDSGGGGNRLFTEKVAGNVCGCMGFAHDSQLHTYAPNTVLKQDVRNMVVKPVKILVVYEKGIGTELYPLKPVNTAKELRGKELHWPPEIACKISSPN